MGSISIISVCGAELSANHAPTPPRSNEPITSGTHEPEGEGTIDGGSGVDSGTANVSSSSGNGSVS